MKNLIYILLLSISFSACGQGTLEELLSKHNNETVPYISVEQLQEKENQPQLVLLDTRAMEEYRVSHLKNAQWVGFEDFNIEEFKRRFPEKDREIIVYCSLGVRSEKIGEQLQKAGFTNVQNLFGGIFEWKNKGNPVYDSGGNKTEKVHAYSKKWGVWLKKGEKVY
jgi:rhodanese-related sulfurtransferase